VTDPKRAVGSLARLRESSSIVGLAVVLVGSVVIALLVSAAAPGSTGWLFQSPVSPVGPGAAASPVAPQGTVTGPALVAVPARLEFLPWVLGLLAGAVIFGAVMVWRRGREQGGSSV
jgi:hypothetical protein